ncbi:MAG TPA: hypothetical protein VH391_07730 [Solirubrobacterales bacterium]
MKDAATEEPFDEFLGLELRRVVMAPRQENSIRVLAVELYDDGVIARFLLREGDEPSEFARARGEPEGRISFRLSDDLDTTYRWTRTGSTLVLPKATDEEPGARVDGLIICGDAVFVPAIPDDATRLSVLTVETLVEIPLDAASETDRL